MSVTLIKAEVTVVLTLINDYRTPILFATKLLVPFRFLYFKKYDEQVNNSWGFTTKSSLNKQPDQGAM